MVTLAAALISVPAIASANNAPRDGSRTPQPRREQAQERLQDGSCGKETCDGERQHKRQLNRQQKQDGSGQGRGNNPQANGRRLCGGNGARQGQGAGAQ
ncbi:MAG: hypothetical protein LAT83_11535 [Kiritimatiellae bacterium]|nr:hypothetical protein [Kiritimatiellia bacterium]